MAIPGTDNLIEVNDGIPRDGKHPKDIIVDKVPEAERVKLSDEDSNSLTRAAFNSQGHYKQWDTYIKDGQSKGLSSYTNQLVTQDYLVKVTSFVDHVFFEPGDNKLATADSNAAKSDLNDGVKEVHKAALAIIEKLQLHKDMEIVVEGHASKTPYSRIDPKTKLPEIDPVTHKPVDNMTLSRERAEAVTSQLLEEVKKLHPELVSRIHNITKGKGDTDLAVATDREETLNRGVEISSVTKAMELKRTYEVIHLDKEAIDGIKKLGTNHDEPQNIFSIDLAQKTHAGQKFAEKFSMKTPVPAHASIILESTNIDKPIDPAIQKPLEIHISAEKADDFRLLVREDGKHISYRITGDHSVAVMADNRTIASLHYDSSETSLKTKDIFVGTVNVQGHTTPAQMFDAATLTQQLNTQDPKALAAQLTHSIDGITNISHSGDGFISARDLETFRQKEAEVALYTKNADSVSLSTKMGGVYVTKHIGDQDTAPVRASANLTDEISRVVGGNGMEINAAQMAAFNAKHQMFKDLLEKAHFTIPEGQGIKVEEFEKILAGNLSAPAGVKPSDPSPDKGGRH